MRRTRFVMWCCKTERRAKWTGLILGALGGFGYIYLVIKPAFQEMKELGL